MGKQISIKRLLNGDREQWEQFVTDFSPLILAVIRKTLASSGHDREKAYDLLQEFYLRICRNEFAALKRYDPKRARLSTWLAVIARNLTIDYLRRSRPDPLPLDEVPEPGARPPAHNKVEIPFDALPPRQMLIMKLLYEKDLEVRQVARVLGVREQTVRSARHKAIRTLRRIMGRENRPG